MVGGGGYIVGIFTAILQYCTPIPPKRTYTRLLKYDLQFFKCKIKLVPRTHGHRLKTNSIPSQK